jgi:hypothetical protein
MPSHWNWEARDMRGAEPPERLAAASKNGNHGSGKGQMAFDIAPLRHPEYAEQQIARGQL